MPYQIIPTTRFKKHYKSLNQMEKKLVQNKLKLLTQDPLYPSLRTKRIQGTDDLYECSVNMDIRIIWYYENDFLIILLDIGHHGILDQY